jgi:heme exporter protein C
VTESSVSSISKFLPKLTLITLFASIFIVPLMLWYVFTVVPNEQVMGAVYRILYIHVASALLGYLSFGVMLIAGIGYLSTKNSNFVSWGNAATDIALLFTTITLCTGMIWGNAAWNTPFRWEPRLVSFLVHWSTTAVIVALRGLLPRYRLPETLSIFWIMSSVTVPMVWLSIKLMPQSLQLHPQVIDKGGLRHPSFYIGLLLSLLAVSIIWSLLLSLSVRFYQTRGER